MGSRSCGKSFEEWSPRLRTNVHTNLYSFHTHTSGYFFFFFIYSKIITGLYLLGKNTERAQKCIQLNKIKDSWPQPLRLQLHFHVKRGLLKPNIPGKHTTFLQNNMYNHIHQHSSKGWTEIWTHNDHTVSRTYVHNNPCTAGSD